MTYVGKKPADIIATAVDTTTGTFSGDLTVDTNTLYVDSSNNRVGVGTSSPSTILTVSSGASSASVHSYSNLEIESSSHSALQFSGSTAGEQWIWFADDTTATPVGGITYYHAGPYMGFRVEGSERMRIDSSGRVSIGTSTIPTSDSVLTIRKDGSANEFNILSGTSSASVINMGDANDYNIQRIKADNTDNSLHFQTNNSEKIRITSAGEVGIGNTFPQSFNAQANQLVVGTGSGANGITIYSGSDSTGDIFFADGFNASDETRGGINYNHTNNYMNFRVNDAPKMYILSSGNVGIGTSSPSDNLHLAESGATSSFIRFSNSNVSNGWSLGAQSSGRFQLTQNGVADRLIVDSSGKLLINTTSTLGAGQGVLHLKGASGNTVCVVQVASNGERGLDFRNSSGTEVGSISVNSSSTAYNTSSDHRLKENVTADWDATTRLKQLNPVRFNFIADADTTVDGFLAHEVQSVVPEAISGTHNEVDDNGSPIYQGIDQSKLVPLLVKTIQELEARITALENA